jgi:hypothetical protein
MNFPRREINDEGRKNESCEKESLWVLTTEGVRVYACLIAQFPPKRRFGLKEGNRLPMVQRSSVRRQSGKTSLQKQVYGNPLHYSQSHFPSYR